MTEFWSVLLGAFIGGLAGGLTASAILTFRR